MRRLTTSEAIKVLVIICAILLIVVCWAGYKGYNYKRNCTAQTQGEITYVRRGGRSLHKRFEVAFSANGNYYVAKGGTHGFDMIHPGEIKEVHYNPNDPTESYAGSKPKEWAYILTYFVFFLIVGVLTFGYTIISPKQKTVNE
ncbi:MAG TPA: hypothetical protein DCL29_03865 [Eubacterium sp.]|nr:hypothetical protein [Eubacterium sp.]HAV90000.1 hypothetical protein [Eubacterium sp.]